MCEETINVIAGLLDCEVERTKDIMMTAIVNGVVMSVLETKIQAYRKAMNARDEFAEWCEENEDND